MKRETARLSAPWKVVALILTCLLTSALGVASADEASDAYRKGKAYLEERKAPQALEQLERACQLKPASERYRRALAEAHDLYLDYASKTAPALGAGGFSYLVKIAETCQRIGSADGRTQSVLRELGKQRSIFLGQIEKALAAAHSDDIETAKQLLAPVLPHQTHFARVSHVQEEISYRERLRKIRSLKEAGKFEEALAELGSTLLQRPNASDSLALQSVVAAAYVESMKTVLAPHLASNRLADHAAGLALVARAEKACPVCKGRFEGADDLRGKYRKGVERHLLAFAKANSAPASWARCQAVEEARAALGEVLWPGPEGTCNAERGRLAISVEVSGPRECGRPSLDPILRTVLPAGARIVNPSSVSQGGGSSLDLGIEVEFLSCDSGSLGERKVQAQSSVYTAGVQQLVNSEYVELERELRDADSNFARFQALASANPSDVGSALAALAASIRVGNLRKQLRNTSAYLERPVEVPYNFEAFEAGVGARMRAVIRLADPGDPAIRLEAEVSGSDERWSEGVRGVAVTDARGRSNREPMLPGQAELAAAAMEKLSLDLREKVGPLVGAWLASRASVALRGGREADAIGYLLQLKSIQLSSGPSGLVAIQRELPATALLSKDDVVARREALARVEASSRQAAAAPSRVSSEGRAATAGNDIERALRALLVVERGNISGSGFFVSPDGLILTNFHVIDTPGPIAITTSSGDQYLAAVVREDRDADLALLRIQGRPPHHLLLASPSEVGLGTDLFALGSPKGLRGSVTKGVLSAKRRLGSVEVLQVDVPINPGNSGGPLLLPDGRAVGINTFKLRDSEGLNFAVSTDQARRSFGAALPR